MIRSALLLMFYIFEGASSDSISLLGGHGASQDEGRESDQIYEFDGASSAVTIDPTVLEHLTSTFTLSTWLKHKHHPEQDKHVKEHILCSADDHSKFTVKLIL